MRRKVVQWGTGEIGRRALEFIIAHPELELRGVIVHDADKAGRDAAELCGLADSTGVRATTDVDAALAVDPDAVCYMAVGTGARGKERALSALDDIAGILRRGIDVVSTSVTPLVYPPSAPAEWREPIERACQAGGASCFFTGAHPGFFTDLLPLTLTGLTGRIDSLTIWEIISYETWSKPDKLRSHFGLGMPASYDPPTLAPGYPTKTYGAVLAMMADLLSVRLERVEERHQSWFTPEPMRTSGGCIAAGTRAAIQFGIYGISEGRETIILDHIYRAHPSAAPEWRQPPGTGGYAIDIKGDPSWTADLAFRGRGGTALDAGQSLTAVRAVNAISTVCTAKPGLLTPFDLPLIAGRGLFYPPQSRR